MSDVVSGSWFAIVAVEDGKIRLHSIPIRHAFMPSDFARLMSPANESFQPPGPFSGRSPLTCMDEMFEGSRTHCHQSVFGSLFADPPPISVWNQAPATPQTNLEENFSLADIPALAVAGASAATSAMHTPAARIAASGLRRLKRGWPSPSPRSCRCLRSPNRPRESGLEHCPGR